VSQALNDQLEKEGMTLLIGHKATAFRKEGGRAVAVLEDPDGKVVEVSAALVLVAVGRKPNLKGLELEKAGIEVERGQLKVNEYLQTTNENVFACGDVVPPYQFSHVAAYEAMVCVRNALFVNLPLVRQKVNYENIAWATFTEPEIAHLGLTEAEARDRYNDDLQVFTTGYDASDRATTDVETEGFLKIITDSRDNLLGAHIVGAHASELIQGFLIAKSAGLGLSKVSQTLFIYPTLSELVKKTAAKPLLERTNKPWLRYIMGMFKSV
jgi:pyruvate/2-oxoglutarate dehydrogenase complex dihydrolipoamide dehydrogenase (E3) component